MEIINYNLIKHPLNWVIVFLMVFIGGIAIHLVLNWEIGLPSLAPKPKP